MAIKELRRVVSVEFWKDDKVLDNFSPEDKLFMLYLLTNPQSTQIGVYNINKKTMAYELGYSIETITVLLDRFEHTYGMIRYNPETHEIAIKNYLRHSILNGGVPVECLLRKEIAAVKDQSLLWYVFDNVMQDANLNASVSKVIGEFYAANESRDESYNESCTNRGTNGTPSIINNQLSDINSNSSILSSSNNIVVVNNTKTRARTREEPNHHDEDYNPFGDGGPDHPADTLESYAANNIVNMNGRNMEELVDYMNKLPEPLIRFAIDMANKHCKTGIPTFGYVDTILKGFVARKFTTVEQAKAAEEARQAQREQARPTQKTTAQESDAYWGRIPFAP